MNKKAQTISYKMLLWIPKLVFLILVIISTSGIILAFIVTNVNVGDIESHILMHRLQFSPEGIADYDTETKRVYTGTIDVNKLSSNNLESALKNSKNQLAARFVLTSLHDETESTVYLYKDAYANWQPLAIISSDKDVTGTGRKFPHEETRYVYSTNSKPSILETVVITPNG